MKTDLTAIHQTQSYASMKAEMMEKYGIGKRQVPARGISSNIRDNKVKFAADLGIDPTGLNFG